MKFPIPLSLRVLRAYGLTAVSFASLIHLHSAEIKKADNTNGMNNTSSWVGGAVPGAGDIALFDSTLTVSRSAAIGANQSWAGIKVTNPAAGSTQTVATSVGFTLTLGSSGIDMSEAAANLTVSAVMDLSASQTWTVAAGRTLTVSGANTGAGTISLAGSGVVAIGNNAAFGTGTVNMDGITLTSNSASSRTIANSVNLTGNIGVSMTGASSSVFMFNGDVNIGSGTRTVTVSNANGSATNTTLTFAGGGQAGVKQISGAGVLELENGNTADTPVVNVRFGTSATDYSLVQSDVSIGNNVSVSFGVANVFGSESDLTVKAGGVLNLSNNAGSSLGQTFKSLSGAGTVTNNTTSTGTSVLTLNGSSGQPVATFSGVIQSGATGAVALVKSGGSVQALSGANTYTGTTTINGGALLVNGTHAQTSTGLGYSVNSGGTLGGGGRIARFNAASSTDAVTVASGGFIAPGGETSPGTLTLDGGNFTGTAKAVLRMNSGAAFNFRLSGAGGVSDQLAFWNYVSGDLLLNANAVNLSLVGPQQAGTYTVSLFTFFSDGGSTAATSGIVGGLIVGDLGSGIGSANLIFNGTSVDLSYTVLSAVPEPASFALLAGLGIAGIAVLRRRRG